MKDVSNKPIYLSKHGVFKLKGKVISNDTTNLDTGSITRTRFVQITREISLPLKLMSSFLVHCHQAFSKFTACFTNQ